VRLHGNIHLSQGHLWRETAVLPTVSLDITFLKLLGPWYSPRAWFAALR
jgi:hypothetical protein